MAGFVIRTNEYLFSGYFMPQINTGFSVLICTILARILLYYVNFVINNGRTEVIMTFDCISIVPVIMGVVSNYYHHGLCLSYLCLSFHDSHYHDHYLSILYDGGDFYSHNIFDHGCHGSRPGRVFPCRVNI